MAETEEFRVLFDAWVHNPIDADLLEVLVDSLKRLALVVVGNATFLDFDAFH